MIYLDTHVVAWLYAGLVEKFEPPLRTLINENEVGISPIVRLELQYLYEIRRLAHDATRIVGDLERRIGLVVRDVSLDALVSRALIYNWTRDPFDRLIVAQASLEDAVLLTKDRVILANYPRAQW